MFGFLFVYIIIICGSKKYLINNLCTKGKVFVLIQLKFPKPQCLLMVSKYQLMSGFYLVNNFQLNKIHGTLIYIEALAAQVNSNTELSAVTSIFGTARS